MQHQQLWSGNAPGIVLKKIRSHPTNAKGKEVVVQVGLVTIMWKTNEPYESVLLCQAPRCCIMGLNLDHSSPSVANNFAVYNQVERLIDC